MDVHLQEKIGMPDFLLRRKAALGLEGHLGKCGTPTFLPLYTDYGAQLFTKAD
jgi:hypothetical protein